METEITSVKENPLLDRFEVEVALDHEGEATPSEEDVVSRIAAENDLDETNIQVEGIYTGFGSNTSRVELKITEEFEYPEDLEEETIEEQEETGETEVEEDGAEEEQEDGEAEEETDVEEDDVSEEDIDYEEIVSGTISDAKDALNDLDNVDWDAALEAEKDNKNRTTFIDWLESRAE